MTDGSQLRGSAESASPATRSAESAPPAVRSAAPVSTLGAAAARSALAPVPATSPFTICRIDCALVAAWAALFPVVGLVRLFTLDGGSVNLLPAACSASLALMMLLYVVSRASATVRAVVKRGAAWLTLPTSSAVFAVVVCGLSAALLFAPSIPIAFACYAAALAFAAPICARAAMGVLHDSGGAMRATCCLALVAACVAVLLSSQVAGVLGSVRNISLRTGMLLSFLSVIMLAVAVLSVRDAVRACSGAAKEDASYGESSAGAADGSCSDAALNGETVASASVPVSLTPASSMVASAPAPAPAPVSASTRAPVTAEVSSLAVEAVLNAMPLLGGAVAFVCGFFLSVFWSNVLDATDVLAAGVGSCAVVCLGLGLLRHGLACAKSSQSRITVRTGMLGLLAPCLFAVAFSVAAVVGLALGQGAGMFWCIGLLLAANTLLVAVVLCAPIKTLGTWRSCGRISVSYALFEAMLVVGVMVRQAIGLDATHVVASAIGCLAMLVATFFLIMLLSLRKLLAVSERASAAHRSAAAAAAAADAAASRAAQASLAVHEAVAARDQALAQKEASSQAHLQGARATLDAARREFLEPFGLTDRELSIALDFLDGKTMAATADHLGISVNTVRYNMGKIYAKAGVASKAELMAKAEQSYSGSLAGEAN